VWLLCCDMALTYCEVKKAGVGFTPLRAVGLAVEEAHKLAKRTGTGKVTVEDLEEVRVTGDKVQAVEEGCSSSRGSEAGGGGLSTGAVHPAEGGAGERVVEHLACRCLHKVAEGVARPAGGVFVPRSTCRWQSVGGAQGRGQDRKQHKGNPRNQVQ
jgi:hypothetical protein